MAGFQMSWPASPLPEPSRSKSVDGTCVALDAVALEAGACLLLMNGLRVLSMEIMAAPAISGV